MKKDRQIIHVDMDAFFASVEQLDNPSLAGKPVVVGGSPQSRGVVAAASYEVRKYGVHSAMPMAQAVKLCPQIIILPVRMARYAEISKQVNEIFERFTPLVESVSIDEAFLDVTDSINLFGSAEKIGLTIKEEIKNKTYLTASVGIAPNKLLAKIASDLEKPDGFVVITEENKQRILDLMPVGKLWGVGKVTEKTLQSHGIRTIAQLRTKTVEQLRGLVGNFAPTLLEYARGIDNSQVVAYSEPKSISTEYTFETNVADKNILLQTLLSQVEEVSQKLRHHNVRAKTITLKLRYGNFQTISRSKTLQNATDATETLWTTGKEVFETWFSEAGGALRLIGFEASHFAFEQKQQQLLLPFAQEVKQQRLDNTIDKIREKFGDDAVKRKQ